MRRSTARVRLALAAASVIVGTVLVGPAAAAEEPVDLNGAYILDTVGALDGREGEVQAAVDSLYDDTGVQLFVVYVDDFDGVQAGESWAIPTAQLNGLGTNDVLLAVATESRNYDFYYPDGIDLDDNDKVAVEDQVLPLLSDSDWSGAAIAAADAYRNELAAPGIPWPVIIGAVVLLVIALLVVVIRRRRGTAKQKEATRLNQKELDLRVGTLLVQLDDSVKTSEQELAFAVAQFGDETSKPFTAVLDSAKQKVAEAFRIKQQLDDAVPENDEQKRAMGLQIVELCKAADKELDDQADAFDELRDLERTAPASLVQVRADAAALAPRVGPAKTALDDLRSRFSDAAVTTIADNPDRAAELLQFVETSAASADSAIAEGNGGRAAVIVRTARASVGQATQLLDAIDNAGSRLAEATSKLDAAIADTRHDVAAAKAMQGQGSFPALAPAIAAAESSLQSATDGAAARDPLARLARLQEANQELEQVFGTARDAQAYDQRARASLDSVLATAQNQIGAASDFISTRRGAVGERARTRLAEAVRHFDNAVSIQRTQPVAALAQAQQANTLATNAIDAAQNDVASYQSSPWGSAEGGYSEGGYSEGGNRGSYGGGGQPGLGGLLGGIAMDAILGGGSRPGGGMFGGGGGYGSGRRSGGGGFGGGGMFGGGFGGSSRSGSGRSGGFGGSSRSGSARSGGFGGSSRSGSGRSGGGSSRRGRF